MMDEQEKAAAAGAGITPAAESGESEEPVEPVDSGTAPQRASQAAEGELGDGDALSQDAPDELAAMTAKAGEYLDLAQRTRAELENYRKRAAREASLAQGRGVARLAKELLPAIDNLDRAIQHVTTGAEKQDGAEDSELVSGIKLVASDLLAALGRVGIEPFGAVGEAFDPQWHEAVAQVPMPDSASGSVVEVYQLGYRLGETVLRPARVLVAA